MRTGVDNVGVGGGKIGFGFADVGTLCEQFRWQSRCDTRVSNTAQSSAADLDAFRRPPHQNRKGDAVQTQSLFERRNGRPLRVDQAFLLCRVERGGGSRLQPLLDQVEHTCGAGNVLMGNPQPVLRRENLKIRIGGSYHCCEADNLAIIAAGDRDLFGRTQQ